VQSLPSQSALSACRGGCCPTPCMTLRRVQTHAKFTWGVVLNRCDVLWPRIARHTARRVTFPASAAAQHCGRWGGALESFAIMECMYMNGRARQGPQQTTQMSGPELVKSRWSRVEWRGPSSPGECSEIVPKFSTCKHTKLVCPADSVDGLGGPLACSVEYLLLLPCLSTTGPNWSPTNAQGTPPLSACCWLCFVSVKRV